MKTTLYDCDTFEHAGLTFKVKFPYDDDCGAPWENEDGHGEISDWTSRAKRPGEWVLIADRGKSRFYDAQGAMQLAKRDGWNAEPYSDTETAGERAAKAVKADYEHLRRWCNDQWHYVGVVVELADMGESESLWGIESDSERYLTETAYELADDIISRLEHQFTA